jgi:hypothetical protein
MRRIDSDALHTIRAMPARRKSVSAPAAWLDMPRDREFMIKKYHH